LNVGTQDTVRVADVLLRPGGRLEDCRDDVACAEWLRPEPPADLSAEEQFQLTALRTAAVMSHGSAPSVERPYFCLDANERVRAAFSRLHVRTGAFLGPLARRSIRRRSSAKGGGSLRAAGRRHEHRGPAFPRAEGRRETAGAGELPIPRLRAFNHGQSSGIGSRITAAPCRRTLTFTLNQHYFKARARSQPRSSPSVHT
jgi:hypothetical protein